MQAPQDPETAFRLLVKAPSTNPSHPSLALGDHTWNCFSYAAPPTDDPRYLCVSYAWDNDRVASPLDTGHSISIRAIPVLNILLQYRLPEAV